MIFTKNILLCLIVSVCLSADDGNQYMYFNNFKSEYKNIQDPKTGGVIGGKNDLVYKLIQGISMNCIDRGAEQATINDIDELVQRKIIYSSGAYRVNYNGKTELYNPSKQPEARISKGLLSPVVSSVTDVCKIPVKKSFKIVALEKENSWSYEKANENCTKQGARLPYLYEVQSNREKIETEFKKFNQASRPIIVKEGLEYFLDKETVFANNSKVMGLLNACLCVEAK